MISGLRTISFALILPGILFCCPVEADSSTSTVDQASAKDAKAIRDPELPELTKAQKLEIQEWVRELQRQRARNRTRAENQLKKAGPAAVAYLLPVARSRFDLARIAAFRVLLQSPRYEAVSVALEGLEAENRWVRKLSWQLIQKISGIQGVFPWESEDLKQLRSQKGQLWKRWYRQQEKLREREDQQIAAQAAAAAKP
ncbi:MAG: hypothetical protein AAEJ04_03875 [Planctomycetota bacterium]